CQKYSSSPYRF
nr:immunoglobulin light chain junction region [Macaca mulatta]